MSKTKEVKLGFTTIMHNPRLEFELSNNEYCVADLIYHLANNPNGAVLGWCYASRESIGKFFGLSRQTIINIIENLTEKGLVVVHQETRYLKTTSKWYESFVLYKMKQPFNKV